METVRLAASHSKRSKQRLFLYFFIDVSRCYQREADAASDFMRLNTCEKFLCVRVWTTNASRRVLQQQATITNLNSVLTFDHIFSVSSYFISPPSLLLRCYHGNNGEHSAWLHPSLFSWTTVSQLKLPISPWDPSGEEEEIVWIYFD